MMRMLMIDAWKESTITYWERAKDGKESSRQIRVKFLPGSREKIALALDRNEPKRIFWFNRTLDRWRRTDSIYSLWRMLAHMQEGYAIELPKVTELLTTIRDLEPQLIVLKTLPSKDLRALRETINDSIIVLEGARHQWKVEAREQLEYLFFLKDGDGKTNVVILRTHRMAADVRIEARMEETLSIKPWVAYYLCVVERSITELEYLLHTLAKLLEPYAWNRKAIPSMHTLSRAMRDLDQLVLPPYRFLRFAGKEEIGKAQQALVGGAHEEARLLVRQTWEACAMKQVRCRLEQLLLSWNRTTTRAIIATIAACHNDLSPRRITENGFRYPVKRKEAQEHLEEAIRALREKNRGKKTREVVKEATHAL